MLLKLSQNKCYIHHHLEIILFITPATRVLPTILVKHTPSEGTFLSAQCLKFCTSPAGGTGSIPGRGTEILHAAQSGQEQNKKRNTHSVILPFAKHLDNFISQK